MTYRTGNPYATKQSLAPAKPRPAPYPVARTGETRDEQLNNAETARQRMALRMRRAANPWEFD